MLTSITNIHLSDSVALRLLEDILSSILGSIPDISLTAALTPKSVWKLLPQPFGGKFNITNAAGIDIYVIASYGGTILAKRKIPRNEEATIKVKTLSLYYCVTSYAYQEGLENMQEKFLLTIAGGLLMATGIFAPVGAKAIRHALGPVSGVATVDGVGATIAKDVEVTREGYETKTINALVKCDWERFTFRLRLIHINDEKRLTVSLKPSESSGDVKWLKDPTDYVEIMELELKAH